MSPFAGWGEFTAAFAFFLLSHSIPVRPPVRAALVAWLGTTGFTIAYSALSLGALAWLIGAAGRAPVVTLWDWTQLQNHVTFAAMALACAISALAIGRPNPLSFGGANNERFDPDHPGIVGWFRHPLLVALLFWSLGHLVPNGQLAHFVMFGVFAGFCLLGMKLIDRRKQRQLGVARWEEFASGPREIRISADSLLRLLLAGAAYLVLLLGHGPVIGIQPAF